MCKILYWNSKRLLRKPQKMLGGYFILPHPVDNIHVHHMTHVLLSHSFVPSCKYVAGLVTAPWALAALSSVHKPSLVWPTQLLASFTLAKTIWKIHFDVFKCQAEHACMHVWQPSFSITSNTILSMTGIQANAPQYCYWYLTAIIQYNIQYHS